MIIVDQQHITKLRESGVMTDTLFSDLVSTSTFWDEIKDKKTGIPGQSLLFPHTLTGNKNGLVREFLFAMKGYEVDIEKIAEVLIENGVSTVIVEKFLDAFGIILKSKSKSSFNYEIPVFIKTNHRFGLILSDIVETKSFKEMFAKVFGNKCSIKDFAKNWFTIECSDNLVELGNVSLWKRLFKSVSIDKTVIEDVFVDPLQDAVPIQVKLSFHNIEIAYGVLNTVIQKELFNDLFTQVFYRICCNPQISVKDNIVSIEIASSISTRGIIHNNELWKKFFSKIGQEKNFNRVINN